MSGVSDIEREAKVADSTNFALFCAHFLCFVYKHGHSGQFSLILKSLGLYQILMISENQNRFFDDY